MSSSALWTSELFLIALGGIFCQQQCHYLNRFFPGNRNRCYQCFHLKSVGMELLLHILTVNAARQMTIVQRTGIIIENLKQN